MKKNVVIIIVATIAVLASWQFHLWKITKLTTDISSPAKENKLKIVTLENLDDANFLIDLAKEKGFFTKAGVAIEENRIPKDAHKVLMAGETDAVVVGMPGFLIYYMNGSNTKWVASLSKAFASSGVSRFAREKISSVRKIGVTSFGTEAQIMGMIAVKNFGLDLKKVEFIAVPNDKAKREMLKKKEIDFAIVKGIADQKDYGNDYVIFRPDEIYRDYNLYKGVMTSEKAMAEKEKEIQAFVTGLKESLEFAKNNKKEVIELLKNKYAYQEAKAISFYEQFINASEGVELSPDVSKISNVAELVKSEFKTENPNRPLDGFIDLRFSR